MWFGTRDGLNRYDGHKIKVYQYEPHNMSSISNNDINCIYEDDQKRLWIGTENGGLNVFDHNKENFKRIRLLEKGSREKEPQKVLDISIGDDQQLLVSTWQGVFKIDLSRSIFKPERIDIGPSSANVTIETKANDYWIGCEKDGLYRFSSSNQKHHIAFEKYDDLRINDIAEAEKGLLWIATNWGLLKYDIQQETARNIPLQTTGDQVEITSLALGVDSKLWLGTLQHGIIALDKKTESAQIYNSIPDDPNSPKDAGIMDIYFDDNNLLWSATRGLGVQVFNPQAPFKYYGHDETKLNTLRDPSVRAILTDDSGLWVGGYSGLSFFSKNDESHLFFGADKAGLANDNVYALSLDGKDKLWIGSEGGGLFSLDKTTGLISKAGPEKENAFPAKYIYEIYTSKDSSVYLGTENGLFVIRSYQKNPPKAHKIIYGTGLDEKLDSETVFAINEDRKGNLYIGTRSAGLFVINKFNEKVAHYFHDRTKRGSIPSNHIKVLHFAQDESLWIGTGGGGLVKLNLETSSFTHFDEKDGLSDNTVYGILEDEKGLLWVSTNKGISLVDKKEGVLRKFGLESGLQSLEFNTGAFHKSQEGEMYFGGVYGLNSFNPNDPRFHKKRLPVVFTDFKVSNNSVPVGSPLLPEDVNSIEKLKLTHNEMLVSFEFSGMDFLSNHETRYRYMLTGVDDIWRYTSPGERIATYTHLPPGRRELLVQASPNELDDFGVLRRLKLIIYPPPWKTWWAKTIYLLLVGYALMAFRKNEINKMTLRVELNQKRQDAQKYIEQDDLKSRMISNFSHELRTPLTLLVGHIKILASKYSENPSPALKTSLNDAQKSLTRITDLSDQLNELSTIAAGKMNLQAKPENLTNLVNLILSEQKGLGEQKAITFKALSSNENLRIYLDKQKFHEILSTLIRVSIEFSVPGGDITLLVIDDQKDSEKGIGSFAFIQVNHTGEAIPQAEHQNLFDGLYQMDSSQTEKSGVTGISLALVKEMIELHGGSISIESMGDGETSIQLAIPKGRFHLQPEEIISDEQPSVKEAGLDKQVVSDPTKQKILIVEDDIELLGFIKQVLWEDYSITTAQNGEEGYQVAQTTHPDLVISDIAMPKKSGFDMLRNIRQDPVLFNIPVIFLTALVSQEDRLKGYEAYVNDYISKPFNIEELKIRIRNILQSRKQLVQSTQESKAVSVTPDDSVSKEDTKVFKRVKEVIEENLEDSDLNVELVAKSVFMSKRQLERKLKEITGISPAEFIRQMRFIHARQLLMDGSVVSVAEASLAVGFKNVKYFSRLYRNQFGQSPAEILKS